MVHRSDIAALLQHVAAVWPSGRQLDSKWIEQNSFWTASRAVQIAIIAKNKDTKFLPDNSVHFIQEVPFY